MTWVTEMVDSGTPKDIELGPPGIADIWNRYSKMGERDIDRMTTRAMGIRNTL